MSANNRNDAEYFDRMRNIEKALIEKGLSPTFENIAKYEQELRLELKSKLADVKSPSPLVNNKEINIEKLNNIVLLYLQGKELQFSGDSVNGYPFISKLGDGNEINLEAILEDFAYEVLENTEEFLSVEVVNTEGWISPEIKLPEANQKVLFMVSDTDMRKGSFLLKDQWDRPLMFCDGSFFKAEDVLSWMPLPKSPTI